MVKIKLTRQELNHILAALRLWQRNGCNANTDIATGDGENELMTDDEIDELCESLNCGGRNIR